VHEVAQIGSANALECVRCHRDVGHALR
jgi:hypothetical protein